MRYKKGDKVIIKSREWYNENKDESASLHLVPIEVTITLQKKMSVSLAE